MKEKGRVVMTLSFPVLARKSFLSCVLIFAFSWLWTWGRGFVLVSFLSGRGVSVRFVRRRGNELGGGGWIRLTFRKDLRRVGSAGFDSSTTSNCTSSMSSSLPSFAH